MSPPNPCCGNSLQRGTRIVAIADIVLSVIYIILPLTFLILVIFFGGAKVEVHSSRIRRDVFGHNGHFRNFDDRFGRDFGFDFGHRHNTNIQKWNEVKNRLGHASREISNFPTIHRRAGGTFKARINNGRDGFEEEIIMQANKKQVDDLVAYAVRVLIIVLACELTLGIIGLVMSIFLLKGANERNANKCIAWMIWTAVGWILTLVLVIFYSYYAAIFALVVKLYFMWVAYAFIKEVQMQKETGGGGNGVVLNQPPPAYQEEV